MLVPSIDLMSGHAVQLIGGKERALDAGDPRPIAERFGMVGEIAVIDLDAALGQGNNRPLIEELCRSYKCRVGGGIRDFDTARRYLNAGAQKIILGTAARPDLLQKLPRERVLAALDAAHGEVVVDGWRTRTGESIAARMSELNPYVSGYLVTFVELEGRLGGTNKERVPELIAAAAGARLTVAGGVTTADEIADLDRMGADAQVGMALYTGRLSLADAFAAPIRTDREDGLIPTVVADERGQPLGLVWSSRESLRRAIEERRGVYYSRSRKSLWVKGETSGATQRLLRASVDCDRDALLFIVRQEGSGFCHNGTLTCWGEAEGFGALERTLKSRTANPPEGSYTARLLGDPALLEAKLIEEAGELARAETRDEVIGEAADLVFFAMTAMARAGVSMAEVERELDRRALKVQRRPGDAKPRPAATGPHLVPDLEVRLPRRSPAQIQSLERAAVSHSVLEGARRIVDDVRFRGEEALREHAERLGDIEPGAPLLIERSALEEARRALPEEEAAVLLRAADRIRRFAEAQRSALSEIEIAVPGGVAGHRVGPVERAGCYAPGGRHPLPSSVLMTAITARAAGVRQIIVASPRPAPATLAAAAIAGVDAVLAVGGAQAIGALAYGAGSIEPVNIIVGPGNAWVTAAKQLVAGRVGIDMLAGPSELVVLADDSASPELIAADLLAQAEHDPDAFPALVTTSEALAVEVERHLSQQLIDLPTASVARASIARGAAVVCSTMEEALACCDRLAPEHLEIMTRDAPAVALRARHYGALFIGSAAAEVLGDYAAGPNHVLPTGSTARHTAGLSVLTFLRARTYLRIDDNAAAVPLANDAVLLARMEGLEAHARAAERRAAKPGGG